MDSFSRYKSLLRELSYTDARGADRVTRVHFTPVTFRILETSTRDVLVYMYNMYTYVGRLVLVEERIYTSGILWRNRI